MKSVSIRSAPVGRKTGLACSRLFVPVDFSTRSRRAVKYAGTLAQRLGAALDLLFVLEPAPPYAVELGPLLLRSDVIQRRARGRLKALAQSDVPSGVPTAVMARRGKAWKEIVAAADERRADLIVISTHGYSGMERALLGSTTEQVVRRAPCPVLTLRERTTPGAGRRIRRILVPVDFSEPSRRALAYAAAFAAELGAVLTVFHTVLSIPPPRRLAAFARGLEVESLKFARQDMAALVAKVVRDRVPVDTVVVTGIPRTQILREAARGDHDLIIMATQGKRGLERWVLGSTAEQVLRAAPCPVLLMRHTPCSLQKTRSRPKRHVREMAVPVVPLPP